MWILLQSSRKTMKLMTDNSKRIRDDEKSGNDGDFDDFAEECMLREHGCKC